MSKPVHTSKEYRYHAATNTMSLWGIDTATGRWDFINATARNPKGEREIHGVPVVYQ